MRAVLGTERSGWAEKCLPVPPSSGGAAPSPEAFGFTVEFTPDYEFTIVRWTAQPGFYGPFTLDREGSFVPVAVVPLLGGAFSIRLVFPRLNGCFRLEMRGVPPMEYRCQPFPTDLGAQELPGELVRFSGPVAVLETGRAEAPVAVVWRASGGPTDLLFRIDRVGDVAYFEAVSLSYVGASLGSDTGDTLVFLDARPNLDERCYRVTAVSGAMETVIGEACLDARAPGPPGAGNGQAGQSDGLPLNVVIFGVILLAGAVARERTAR